MNWLKKIVSMCLMAVFIVSLSGCVFPFSKGETKKDKIDTNFQYNYCVEGGTCFEVTKVEYHHGALNAPPAADYLRCGSVAYFPAHIFYSHTVDRRKTETCSGACA